MDARRCSSRQESMGSAAPGPESAGSASRAICCSRRTQSPELFCKNPDASLVDPGKGARGPGAPGRECGGPASRAICCSRRTQSPELFCKNPDASLVDPSYSRANGQRNSLTQNGKVTCAFAIPYVLST